MSAARPACDWCAQPATCVGPDDAGTTYFCDACCGHEYCDVLPLDARWGRAERGTRVHAFDSTGRALCGRRARKVVAYPDGQRVRRHCRRCFEEFRARTGQPAARRLHTAQAASTPSSTVAARSAADAVCAACDAGGPVTVLRATRHGRARDVIALCGKCLSLALFVAAGSTTLDDHRRVLIVGALTAHAGNQAAAARALGISRSTLRRECRREPLLGQVQDEARSARRGHR